VQHRDPLEVLPHRTDGRPHEGTRERVLRAREPRRDDRQVAAAGPSLGIGRRLDRHPQVRPAPHGRPRHREGVGIPGHEQAGAAQRAIVGQEEPAGLALSPARVDPAQPVDGDPRRRRKVVPVRQVRRDQHDVDALAG
jgi:hypothetical protein